MAFTDPAVEFPMPAAWVDKPIAYLPENAGADLVIVMDQDIYYTLLPLIEKFGRDSKLRIVVKEGTCGIAAGMLAQKTIDMGGFCCPPGMEDRLPGLRYHTMGIVAKAFLVHPDNPVESLTVAEARDVFRGKIQRWSELTTPDGQSGPDWPIRAVGRLHCQKRPGHWRLLLDTEEDFSPRMTEVGTIPDMVMKVAGVREAIGWEVLTMVRKNRERGAVKPLALGGIKPTDSAALARLRYPFYRTYSLSTWEGTAVENAHARQLIDFMIREFDKLPPDSFGFVSRRRLVEAGWRFHGDELVGEP